MSEMSGNPFLALFESSTATNLTTETKASPRKRSNVQTDAQVQINDFYERIFSFTINASKDDDAGGPFSTVYLENLSIALGEKQNYISKDIIGQAICERIFYDVDDLRRLVRKRNSKYNGSITEETRRV